MNLKKKTLLNVLLGTGLYLLDPVRDRLAENIEDITGRAKDSYDEASERLGRAGDVLTGHEHRGLSTAVAILIGVGIGVGVGMLLAPASGEETRSNLAGKVHDFSDRVKSRTTGEPQPASGTYGE